MGGSILVNGKETARIDLEDGIGLLYRVMLYVQDYAQGTGWQHALENYLAGSARVALSHWVQLRNKQITIGDIDLMVDRKTMPELNKWFEWMVVAAQEDLYYDMELVSYKSGKQRSTAVFDYHGKLYQVDFIAADFENGLPLKFFNMSHSSHRKDLFLGIKGYAHKLLLRSLTAGTDWHLSVDYGLRKEGSSEYETDFDKVMSTLINANYFHCWSFVDLFKQAMNQPNWDLVFDKLLTLLFGHGRQRSHRDPAIERENLLNIYDFMHNALHDAKQYTKLAELEEAYQETL